MFLRRRPVALALAAPFLLSCLCTGLCAGLFDPAGTALQEGKDLAAAGENAAAIVSFDEAIAAYEANEAKASTLEAATTAHRGVIDAHLGKAAAYFAADAYVDAAISVMSAELREPGSLATVEPVSLQTNLLTVTEWALVTDRPTDDTLIVAVQELVSRPIDEGLEAHVSTWLCDQAPQLPSFNGCRALGTDVSTVTDLSLLATASTACETVRPLAQLCEGDMKTTVEAMPSTSAVMERWTALTEPLATPYVSAAGLHSRSCASSVRRKEGIEARYMRQILYGNRRAVIDAALAMQPHDEKIDERRDMLDAICSEVRASEWPEAVKQQVVSAVSDANDNCGGYCR